METTFMTIHNLAPNANILFASESIVDILGYQPYEVIGRSCFDYFHHLDIPWLRDGHDSSVKMNKAAVIYYARIRARDLSWVGCECVFTVVHDVLVACTSIYKADMKSNLRDREAKKIQRIFSSPPRDSRYDMIGNLSTKFIAPPQIREPRAALIVNRFSRTLSIMYSTNAVSTILGVSADEIRGKSFYECIEENCLPEAIRCLEGAKANDSIAYLRFFFRDPRRPEDLEPLERDASHSSDSEDGGVQLDRDEMDGGDVPMEGVEQHHSSPEQQSEIPYPTPEDSQAESGHSLDLDHDSANAIFDQQPAAQSSSSVSSAPSMDPGESSSSQRTRRSASRFAAPIEIEAVISCTSDGLVVIIRKAPVPLTPRVPSFRGGFCAAPWAIDPIIPSNQLAPIGKAGSLVVNDFMNSIRDVAVFAWSLTGINGNVASYSHGIPRGEAVPPSGFPIWDPKDPEGKGNQDLGPENQAAKKWADQKTVSRFDNPPGPSQEADLAGPYRNHNSYFQKPSDGNLSQTQSYTQNGYAGSQPQQPQPQHFQNTYAEPQPQHFQNTYARPQPQHFQNAYAESQPQHFQNAYAESQPQHSQNGYTEHQPQHSQNGLAEPHHPHLHSQQQYMLPTMSLMEEDCPIHGEPASTVDQGQGSSGDSHPVRYMWH